MKTIALLAVSIALALTGCVSNSTLVAPYCYQGTVTSAVFSALDLRTDDGKRMHFVDALPSFTSENGMFSRALPFDEVEAQDFTFASLAPLIAVYDANKDGMLEQPEIILLYAREAMFATGTAVRHFGAETAVWAVAASNSDIGELGAHAPQGDGANGRATFRDLQRLSLDPRTRPSEDSDSDDYD
jgi:hypothetical protein